MYLNGCPAISILNLKQLKVKNLKFRNFEPGLSLSNSPRIFALPDQGLTNRICEDRHFYAVQVISTPIREEAKICSKKPLR